MEIILVWLVAPILLALVLALPSRLPFVRRMGSGSLNGLLVKLVVYGAAVFLLLHVGLSWFGVEVAYMFETFRSEGGFDEVRLCTVCDPGIEANETAVKQEMLRRALLFGNGRCAQEAQICEWVTQLRNPNSVNGRGGIVSLYAWIGLVTVLTMAAVGRWTKPAAPRRAINSPANLDAQ